jgi:hypothetical protein
MTSEEAMSFDPHSSDAMFSRVLAKLEEQGAMLNEIRENGRQTELEIAGLKSWRDNLQGRMTVIAALVSTAVGLLASLFIWYITK